jgi:hypothetical protein
MSIAWDSDFSCDVPGVSEAYRGSVLNFKEAAVLIHPVNYIYKAVEDFDFLTNHVVVDIRGGEEMPAQKLDIEDEPLAAPGEYLVLDAAGKLFVANELDDADAFARYQPPVIEVPETTYGMPGGGEEGMYGGEGDYGGGSRGRGRRAGSGY